MKMLSKVADITVGQVTNVACKGTLLSTKFLVKSTVKTVIFAGKGLIHSVKETSK